MRAETNPSPWHSSPLTGATPQRPSPRRMALTAATIGALAPLVGWVLLACATVPVWLAFILLDLHEDVVPFTVVLVVIGAGIAVGAVLTSAHVMERKRFACPEAIAGLVVLAGFAGLITGWLWTQTHIHGVLTSQSHALARAIMVAAGSGAIGCGVTAYLITIAVPVRRAVTRATVAVVLVAAAIFGVINLSTASPRPSVPPLPTGAMVFSAPGPELVRPPSRATVADGVVVVWASRWALFGDHVDVAVLDAATGKERWRRHGVDDTHVVGDTLVEVDGDEAVTFDLATGRRLLGIDDSQVGVTTDSLLVMRCGVKCELSARSPRDGSVRWRRTAGRVAAMPQRPSRLVVVRDNPPDAGRTVATTTLDTRTGKVVTRWRSEYRERDGRNFYVGDFLIEVTSTDVTAYDVRRGQRLWRKPVSMFAPDRGGDVDPSFVDTADGPVLVGMPEHDRITVTDIATGERRWHATGVHDVTSADGVVVTEEGDALVARDAGTGKPRWRSDEDCGSCENSAIAGGLLLYPAESRCVRGPENGEHQFLRADDLRTGTPRWAAETGATELEVIGAGEGWAVTREQPDDVTIRLYRW